MGIIDIEAGSYDCFTLDDDSKSDNAQNYAWLAGVSPRSNEPKLDFCINLT